MTLNDSGVTLSTHGVSLCVRAANPHLVDALRTRAAACGWTEAESSRIDLEYSCIDDNDGVTLRCNGETLVSSTDPDALVNAFEDHAKIEMAWRAPHHVFVHAGVVGWRGAAIVLPGRSRAGKTTLVEALVRAGADYYSDEFAVLDLHGRVHPFAVPLRRRRPDGRERITVETIGGRTPTVALPVKLVAIASYLAGSRWRPRSVSPAVGMLALMDNTVGARRSPEWTMPILRLAIEGATIWRSRRGEADAVAQALLAGVS